MLEVSHQGPVAVIALARGKVNAIDVELLEELDAALDGAQLDDDVRAVVLTGSGRVFSAGVDLHRVVDGGPAYAVRLIAGLRHSFEKLFAFPKPTVAAVNGAAVAGGCILACACDRRIMARAARIGASELVVGVPFPVSAIEIVRHACGSRTEDVVFTGRLLDAEEALSMGMVDEVHDAEAVRERSMAAAAELGTLPPLAFRLAKEQLRRPSLERMRGDADAVDDLVAREWASSPTGQRLRDQLDRMSAGH